MNSGSWFVIGVVVVSLIAGPLASCAAQTGSRSPTVEVEPETPRSGTTETVRSRPELAIDESYRRHVSLSQERIVVPDTGAYYSTRIQVRNDGDSLVVVERVVPSCGCILATLQNAFALPNHAAEIYVSVSLERMTSDQPYEIEVYTSLHREKPLSLKLFRE